MGDGGGLGRVEHTTNSVCIRMRVYVVWQLDFGLWATELSIAVNIYIYMCRTYCHSRVSSLTL